MALKVYAATIYKSNIYVHFLHLYVKSQMQKRLSSSVFLGKSLAKNKRRMAFCAQNALIEISYDFFNINSSAHLKLGQCMQRH